MASPMKILQVCSAESLGGGERHVVDLVRALIERGHELHLAVRPGGPLQRELRNAPVTWHEMNLRNALDVMSAQRIAQVIARYEIDVLHAHVAREIDRRILPYLTDAEDFVTGVATRLTGARLADVVRALWHIRWSRR